MNNPQSKASVGGKELTAMLTVFVASHSFLSYPRFAAASGAEAAWMVPLLSGVVSVIIVLILDPLLTNHFPSKGLIEISKAKLGQGVTVVLCILLALYFLVLTATIMRQFMENVITTVLPNAPIYIVGGLFVGAIVYVAYCGLEGVARIGYAALPVLLVGIIALCLLTMNFWQKNWLLPFWGTGIVHVVGGSLIASSVFTNVLLLCLIRAHMHDPREFRSVALKSTVYSTIILVMFMAVYQMVFTPEEAVKITSPMYSLARTIHLGRFIQRLESVFIFMWVSAAVVKMSITLWATAYCLGFAFNWPSYRPSLPALGLLCFAGSLLPSDIAGALNAEHTYLWRCGWIFAFVIPIVMLAVAVARQRKRGAV